LSAALLCAGPRSSSRATAAVVTPIFSSSMTAPARPLVFSRRTTAVRASIYEFPVWCHSAGHRQFPICAYGYVLSGKTPLTIPDVGADHLTNPETHHRSPRSWPRPARRRPIVKLLVIDQAEKGLANKRRDPEVIVLPPLCVLAGPLCPLHTTRARPRM